MMIQKIKLTLVFCLPALALTAQDREHVRLETARITFGQEVAHTATGTIALAPGKKFAIAKKGNVRLEAGKRIELNPGFSVETGGNFTGMIISVDQVSPGQPQVSKPGLTLYPNPSPRWVNIQSPHVISTVKIRDITGLVVSTQDHVGSTALTLDISSLQKGNYLLEVISTEDVQKIRIEKN